MFGHEVIAGFDRPEHDCEEQRRNQGHLRSCGARAIGIAFVVGPYVKQRAVVSTHYTTVSMVRTIGAVLGLPGLGLNDGLAVPMADVFDLAQAKWDFTAVASDVLRATKLPIDLSRFVSTPVTARPLRDAHYWANAMRGQDFSSEDKLDSKSFNAALWNGLGPPH